jgi:hypothetical protein
MYIRDTDNEAGNDKVKRKQTELRADWGNFVLFFRSTLVMPAFTTMGK